MASHILDNPIWQSLATRHCRFAVGSEQVKRYPQAIGPFIAVPSSDAAAEPELAELVAAGETVYFVGVAPSLSSSWRMEEQSPILQMIYASDTVAGENNAEISVLSEPDMPAMLALTALVYPEYFRSRTAELGNYFGIYQNGQNGMNMLAAMAGERMYLTGHQEISAVCTHPDFLGRGYAGKLVNRVVKNILNRNEVPFLHVSSKNERAISLYERLGFVTRRSIPLWLIQRQQ